LTGAAGSAAGGVCAGALDAGAFSGADEAGVAAGAGGGSRSGPLMPHPATVAAITIVAIATGAGDRAGARGVRSEAANSRNIGIQS
jgi:hypothetical protein